MRIGKTEIPYATETEWQKYVGATRRFLETYAPPSWQNEVAQQAQVALDERMGDWRFRLTHLTAGRQAAARQRLTEYAMTCMRDIVTLQVLQGDDGPFLTMLRVAMPEQVGPPGTPMIVTPPVP
jgi:hypothetical protein